MISKIVTVPGDYFQDQIIVIYCSFESSLFVSRWEKSLPFLISVTCTTSVERRDEEGFTLVRHIEVGLQSRRGRGVNSYDPTGSFKKKKSNSKLRKTERKSRSKVPVIVKEMFINTEVMVCLVVKVTFL